MRRKILELEVIEPAVDPAHRSDDLFQEIGQTLIRSANLYELANRICRYTRDLCGADLAVVYFNRSDIRSGSDVGVGWEKAQLLPACRGHGSTACAGER